VFGFRIANRLDHAPSRDSPDRAGFFLRSGGNPSSVGTITACGTCLPQTVGVNLQIEGIPGTTPTITSTMVEVPMSSTTSRRRFFAAAGGALAAAIVGTVSSRLAFAAELPHLALDDPSAKALNYTEDAGKIDAVKMPAHQVGQACVNCNFYSGRPNQFGPCALFPGKAVNSKGWCSGYAKET
jgi:hypothetical protein